MKNLFNSVKMTRPRKNVFDLTHDVKLACDMGKLVPILAMEAVPGDKFSLSCESLLRFSPLVAPMMHRVDVYMHYFFVPNRILWPNWEKFITNTKLESTDALPAFPTIRVGEAPEIFSILDNYLGVPSPLPVDPEPETISALAHAAYQCVYNEYYRDQNLQAEIPFQLVDGNNNANEELRILRNRAWEHDYFTASLPFAQKGEAVDIPLGNVELNDETSNAGKFVRALDHTYSDVGDVVTSGVEPNANITIDGVQQVYDPANTLTVGATTINDLRRAFRLQEWLEKAARGGSRYIENILMHFGVRSSDKRLQRPEYITGTKSPVAISEVLATTGGTQPQGTMAGHGLSVTTGKYGSYFCEEHGYIIGIMSVMPKTAYQQGMPKHFLKHTDPFQYYWPSFAHIGEQEVLNKEIYAYTPTGTETFGYVPRYAEYKYMPSRVAGEFRDSLAFWHLGRIFETQPALNEQFIECVPREDIFASSAPNQTLLVHVLNKIRAVRPMPKFGTPSF